MSVSDKADRINNVIIDKLTHFDGTSLDSPQDLVSTLIQEMQTSNIIADLAETNPDAAEGLHDNLQALKQMGVLIGQTQAAQAVGDLEAADAFANQVAALGRVEVPEPLPAPYDDLEEALDDGDLEALVEVLKEKPALNKCVGPYDTFALLMAMGAENRSPETLALLVDAGADVRFATPDGRTALHGVADYIWRADATTEDDTAVAAYLVSKGADLEARDQSGCTPLDRAIMEGVTDEMEALLKVGADPNTRLPEDKGYSFNIGDTALAHAVNNPEKVALLLAHGADPAIKTRAGKTLLDLIDHELAEEDPDFQSYFDDLRASRALILAALVPH